MFAVKEHAWHGGAEILGTRPEHAYQLHSILQPYWRRIPREIARPDAPPRLEPEFRYPEMSPKQAGLYKQLAKVKSGAAVAMALADPTLGANEKFGMKVNWGGFDGANAFGLTTMGVLGKDVLSKGDKLTVTAGAGWGQSTVTGYTQSVTGGHAGLQLSW